MKREIITIISPLDVLVKVSPEHFMPVLCSGCGRCVALFVHGVHACTRVK